MFCIMGKFFAECLAFVLEVRKTMNFVSTLIQLC